MLADRSHAPRHQCARLKSNVYSGTLSVPGGIPTQSVGTIIAKKPGQQCQPGFQWFKRDYDQDQWL
ncbi:hypothetical protein EMIT0P294_30737 [Pseudomonas sp. IT-P294]